MRKCLLAETLIPADHPNPEPYYLEIIDTQNLVFLGELWIEVILNAIAYTPMGVINNRWRLFDLVVAFGTTLGYVNDSAQLSQFVKAFRLMRLVRPVNHQNPAPL
jgi:hypothetical protein